MYGGFLEEHAGVDGNHLSEIYLHECEYDVIQGSKQLSRLLFHAY